MSDAGLIPLEVDRVVEEPCSSSLTVAASTGATSLTVEWTGEFSDVGGKLQVVGVAGTYTYTAVSLDETTLTITPALASPGAPVDTAVLACDRSGKPQRELQAWCRSADDAESTPWIVGSDLEDKVTPSTPPGTRVYGNPTTGQIVSLIDQSTPLDLSNTTGTLPDEILAQIPTGPTAAPTAVPTPTVYADSGVAVVTWSAPTEAFTRLRLYVTNTLSGGAVDSSAPKDGTTLYASDVKPGVFVSSLTPGGTALDPSKVYQFALGAFNEVGAGPFSAWVLGTAAQIHSLLIARTAIIGALQAGTVDALSLQGGSIAIGVTASGSQSQAFSGTSLPGTWASVKTGVTGTGTGSGSVPGASVVNSGQPTGFPGSSLLFDYGAGTSGNNAAGKVTTPFTSAADAQVDTRFQVSRIGGSVDPSSLRLMIRRQDLANDPIAEDGVFVEMVPHADLSGGWQFTVSALVNGTPSTLMQLSCATDPSANPHRLKFQVLAGQVQAKVWKDGNTEPDWTSVQQSGVLTPGEVAFDWRQNTIVGAGAAMKVWVDYVNTTTYATGFKVNPDGTGTVVDLATRTTAVEGVNTTQDGRLTALEATSIGTVTASGVFTSTATVEKVGNLGIFGGGFGRATSFSTSFTQCGTVPVGYRPAQDVTFPAATLFNSTITYQIQVIAATGVVNIRQSAATTGNMSGTGVTWRIAP